MTDVAFASYRLSEKARVDRTRRHCVLYVSPLRFAQDGAAGANSKPLSGRIGKRTLVPAEYRALVAKDAAGNASRPARVAFRVVRR